MRKLFTVKRNAEYFIFFLVAYGVNFLFGFLLIPYEYINGEVFAGLMALLPATAVFFIELLYKEEKKENKLLRNIMFALCLFYFVIIFLNIAGVMSDKVTYVISSSATNVGSILFLVFRMYRKERPSIFNQIETVEKSIFLLVLLLVLRNVLNSLPSATMVVETIYSSFFAVLSIAVFFPLFLVSYIGEEYGWRGYLQGKMQDKFGKRWGVILLGVIWELWHMPLWFTQYDLEMWEIPWRFMIAISMSIFLGYIYMRTKNVWICALVHCIYNTVSVISGQKIQGEMSGLRVGAQILVIIVLSVFIFTKEYASDASPIEKQ